MPDRAVVPGQSEKSGCPFFVSAKTEETQDFASLLTPRQLEALALAAAGSTDAGIGLAMGCTQRTARAHLQGARDRLGALNTTHAVAIAIARRLIKPESILQCPG